MADVEIAKDAIQWTGQNWLEICEWLGPAASPDHVEHEDDRPYVLLHTLDGDKRAYPGDWIVRGVGDHHGSRS